MATKNKSFGKTRFVNRAARYHYTITDKLTAGIQRHGYEVKGVREGRVNLKEGFVKVENGEAWLYGVHIGLPSNARIPDYNPASKRKLLLKKVEISRLDGVIGSKGLTAVPLELVWVNNKLKVVIGLGKGKKKHDKRRKLIERDADREVRRLMKKPQGSDF